LQEIASVYSSGINVLKFWRFSMKTRVRIIVSGMVQGVFFRDHTRRWASSLDLTGWVRNLSDGRVEALAEGDKEKVEELIARLQEGPPLARVENVEVNWEDYKGEFKDFRVTYLGYW
jgi:acylphosphatase